MLRAQLARVAAGAAHVVQAGDCAEDPAECTPDYVARKTGLLDVLAGTMTMSTRTAGGARRPDRRPVRQAALAAHRTGRRP